VEHYVYVWRDATGTPFYVGKGSGKRAYDTRQRSKEFKRIHSEGNCSVEIVDSFIHDSQAFELEMKLIEDFGRREYGGLLVNKTDGGEGAIGVIASERRRAKLSAALLGRKKSPEHVANMAAGRRGIKHSDETRLKMSETRKGRKLSPQARANMKAAQQGYVPKVAIAVSAEMRRGKKKPQWAVDKCNLAIRLLPPRSLSGFKGVTFSRRRGTWQAKIKNNQIVRHIGTFHTPEDAARAYDEHAIALWGEGNCYLNFPMEAG